MGAILGGHEAEAEGARKGSGSTRKKRGYTVEPLFGEMKSDGRKSLKDLRGLVKGRGDFLLMCLVHKAKGEGAPGHSHSHSDWLSFIR